MEAAFELVESFKQFFNDVNNISLQLERCADNIRDLKIEVHTLRKIVDQVVDKIQL